MGAIKAGEVVTLSPLVRRITAPNPGPLTGPGTNTYLLGHPHLGHKDLGDKDCVVLDPGPVIDSHIEKILEATAGRITSIVVTHSHDDHSPAAQVLAEKTGAPVIGCSYHDDGYQDMTFQPSRQIQPGEILSYSDFNLEAIATPGHVGNHFCYLLKEEGLLFTGDHIMEGSTVVIIPPSGDMADYLSSLEKLKNYSIRHMAPGHGQLITQPMDYVSHLINHRLKRERKVLEGLAKSGEISLHALTAVVYDDVDPSLHGVASFSLWAHLLKLLKEGRATRESTPTASFGEERWCLVR